MKKGNLCSQPIPTKTLHYSRCETDYHTVEEKSYKEECHEDIQNVCEKHIEVPVPVEVPYPLKVSIPQYEQPSTSKQNYECSFHYEDAPSKFTQTQVYQACLIQAT